jgi:catechol 2,3-dioxygenase-like lactoylglutathione lyase family enzyme
VDYTLELVIVPVADVDRAKAFYTEQCGFTLDVDHRAGEEFRVVQMTPPGSSCSITVLAPPGESPPGSLQGMHLIVADIEVARAELTARGVDASDFYHFGEQGQTDGLHPGRGDYETFFSFRDPDGNGWIVQEVPSRARA